MQEKIFRQGINLIETITNKILTEQQNKAYWLLLNDIPDELFMRGIELMLKERVYSNIPMPAEIRDYCLGTREDDIKIRVTNAEILIKKAMSSIGTYSTVAFEDPIIHLIIRAWGGWIKLGMMSIEEFEDKLKWELPKLYKAYASAKNNDIPVFLEGRGEDKNIHYIGDKNKVLNWISAYEKKYLTSNSATFERKNNNKEFLEFIA